MKALLFEYYPALERAFDYSRSKGALLLLTSSGLRRDPPCRSSDDSGLGISPR